MFAGYSIFSPLTGGETDSIDILWNCAVNNTGKIVINRFAFELTREEWEQVITNCDNPIVYRRLYVAGSTAFTFHIFKKVTTLVVS